MIHPILALVSIGCASGLDYLLVGYNYADLCCDVTNITAIEVEYSRIDQVSNEYRITSYPLINNAPFSDYIFHTSTTTAGTHFRIRLTEKMGFVVGHWYVVCFGTPNDSPGHCSLFRPCDCDCTENAWIRMNTTIESTVNLPSANNAFKLGFDYPITDGHQGVKTPMLLSAWTQEGYYSCPEHRWSNESSDAVSQCKADLGTIRSNNFPDQVAAGAVVSVNETITDVIGVFSVLFEVDKLPPPFTMNNYIQRIGVHHQAFNIGIGMKRKFMQYIRIVGDAVNVDRIDFKRMKRTCANIQSEENDQNSARRHWIDLTILAVVIVMYYSESL